MFWFWFNGYRAKTDIKGLKEDVVKICTKKYIELNHELLNKGNIIGDTNADSLRKMFFKEIIKKSLRSADKVYDEVARNIYLLEKLHEKQDEMYEIILDKVKTVTALTFQEQEREFMQRYGRGINKKYLDKLYLYNHDEVDEINRLKHWKDSAKTLSYEDIKKTEIEEETEEEDENEGVEQNEGEEVSDLETEDEGEEEIDENEESSQGEVENEERQAEQPPIQQEQLNKLLSC